MKRVLLFFLISFFSIQNFAQSINGGLVAYYPLNGNFNDLTGNNSPGQNYGAVATMDRKGVSGSAYYFNGTSSYVDLGNNPLLKRSYSNFSISVWVNLEEYTSTNASIILSNRRDISSNITGSALTIGGSNYPAAYKKASFIIGGGSSSAGSEGKGAINTNVWTHLVMTYTFKGGDKNELRFYINGILDNTVITKDISDPGNISTYLGFESIESTAAGYHFKGSMDELRIYNRVLSPCNIMNLFEKSNLSGGLVSMYGELIAYYPFSGNAFDASGNNNDGKVYNCTLAEDKFGMAESAYLFNGHSSYIDLGNNPLLKRNNIDFTISSWIKLNSYSEQTASIILSNRGKNSDFSNVGYAFTIGGEGYPNAYKKPSFTISGGYTGKGFEGSSTIKVNEWNHMVVTLKKGIYDTLRFYVNGNLDAVYQVPPITDSEDLPTYIGFEPNVDSPKELHFSGFIDEVRIYSRALNICEIDSVMNYKYVAPINSSVAKSENLGVSIMPNPATSDLKIASLNNLNGEIIIIDVHGNILFNEVGTLNNKVINVSDFKPGIYFLNIKSEKGTYREKFLVIK